MFVNGWVSVRWGGLEVALPSEFAPKSAKFDSTRFCLLITSWGSRSVSGSVCLWDTQSENKIPVRSVYAFHALQVSGLTFLGNWITARDQGIRDFLLSWMSWTKIKGYTRPQQTEWPVPVRSYHSLFHLILLTSHMTLAVDEASLEVNGSPVSSGLVRWAKHFSPQCN